MGTVGAIIVGSQGLVTTAITSLEDDVISLRGLVYPGEGSIQLFSIDNLLSLRAENDRLFTSVRNSPETVYDMPANPTRKPINIEWRSGRIVYGLVGSEEEQSAESWGDLQTTAGAARWLNGWPYVSSLSGFGCTLDPEGVNSVNE